MKSKVESSSLDDKLDVSTLLKVLFEFYAALDDYWEPNRDRNKKAFNDLLAFENDARVGKEIKRILEFVDVPPSGLFYGDTYVAQEIALRLILRLLKEILE